MPRYFFDVFDADGTYADEEGMELPDMDAAMVVARRTLGEMVRDAVRGADEAHIEIRIRDGSAGPILLTVTMQKRDETP